ncbi:MAG: hypothetical protein [Bacteriophage sp.]|nr:MAG: hypothetical protein [Bacteriophage sp.]
MYTSNKKGRAIMTEFGFYLSTEDTERLFALKEEAGATHLTGNEYARQLLEATLYRLHPEQVRYDDETGERIPRKRGAAHD